MLGLTLLSVTLLALEVSPVGPTPASADTITVNSGLDNDPVAPDGGVCTLREAMENAIADNQANLDCAEGDGNDTIVFTDALSRVELVDALPVLDDPDRVTIDGDEEVTIDGNDLAGIFEIDGGFLVLLNITVEGATKTLALTMAARSP